ncbi:MAG: biotin transporter BioY [Clostridia bacterium]|nr:biotin transporter BioY [Clostridia bacterium]
MKIREITLTAIFSAVLCLFSIITFPIGAVPVSLATFGVMIAASFIKAKCAIISVLVYIILGCVGLPIFSSFGSGPSVIFGATGGYILSYPIMAAIISTIAQKNKKHRKTMLLLSYIISLIVCHLLGSIWYCAVTQIPFKKAFMVTILPFIIPDFVKIFAAIITVSAAEKSVFKRSFSTHQKNSGVDK